MGAVVLAGLAAAVMGTALPMLLMSLQNLVLTGGVPGWLLRAVEMGAVAIGVGSLGMRKDEAPAPVTAKRRWYLTWTGTGPLTEETTLSVVYSGGRDVTEQDGRVFIASDGSDNPRSKPIGKPRKGWAPD